MDITRRTFLKKTFTGSAVVLGISLLPQAVMAEWPQAAFEAKSLDEILKTLFENPAAEESDKVTIEAPDIAENGSVVEVKVKADLPKVESVTIVAEKNPVPLIAQFNLGEGSEGFVATRIKMAESGNVTAIVKSEGKLYAARKAVKVTVGGCGG
jgi:sulfur-oxidizing protein SoxY